MIRIENNNVDNIMYIPRTSYCTHDIIKLNLYGIGEEKFVIEPESVQWFENFYKITVLKNSFPHEGEFKYHVEHLNVIDSKNVESGLIIVGDLECDVKSPISDKDNYKQHDENNYIEFDG